MLFAAQQPIPFPVLDFFRSVIAALERLKNLAFEKIELVLPEYNRQFKVVWDGLEEIAKVSLTAARQVVETQQVVLEKGRPAKAMLGGGGRTAPAKKS